MPVIGETFFLRLLAPQIRSLELFGGLAQRNKPRKPSYSDSSAGPRASI
jgi:hypothetical protein